MHLPGDSVMGAPEYLMDGQAEPQEIADLRDAVGWNRMEEAYRRPEMRNLFEIGVRQDGKLIGYLCVVSNCVTDAYIQDVMVHPDWQNQGIGSIMMRLAIEKIRLMGIYMISVIYGGEELRRFYEKFGFVTMLCGQMETGKGE